MGRPRGRPAGAGVPPVERPAGRGRYSPVPMPDYDAIVIGAGHNGLTAAAVMAAGGLRVLCLEKNHFIGGMASTTELIRGYRFELAGSIQFPVPNEIFEDLELGSCPIYEPEVQSASIGDDGQPPILLYSDPERLLEHLGETIGIEAVLGHGRGGGLGRGARPGHRSLRRAQAPEVAGRDVGVRRQRDRARGHPDRHVRQRHGCRRPLPARQVEARAGAQHAGFLAVNSTFRGPYSPGSALCLAFALASPGNATMSKVRGGLGTIADHLRALFEQHGGELRRHAKVVAHRRRRRRRQGRRVRRGRGRDRSGGRLQPRPDGDLHPAARPRLPARGLRPAGDAIDHRAAYFQAHFALRGLPEYRGPYEALNGSQLGRNVTFFGTAEQMQLDFEGCVRGQVPPSPSFNLQIPSLDDPTLAPDGMHAASSFAFYLPIGTDRETQGRLRDEMAQRIVAKIASAAPNFPDLDRAPAQLPRLHLRVDVRLHRRGLHPWAAPARVHGTVPSRARGWPDNPVPIDGVYLCGAGCHGGPGCHVHPRLQLRLRRARRGERPVVAELALHEGEEERHGEGEAREEAHDEEDPGPFQSPPPTLGDGPQRHEDHVHDGVVLGRGVSGPVREQHLGVVDVAGRWP